MRVSREEQDSVNQLSQLQGFAAGLGQVVKTYDDCATGKNGDRPAFRQMLEDAARRRFDLVVFWALDRLTREGPLRTLLYLEQLASSGVRFKSFTEPMLEYDHAGGRTSNPDPLLGRQAGAPADQRPDKGRPRNRQAQGKEAGKARGHTPGRCDNSDAPFTGAHDPCHRRPHRQEQIFCPQNRRRIAASKSRSFRSGFDRLAVPFNGRFRGRMCLAGSHKAPA